MSTVSSAYEPRPTVLSRAGILTTLMMLGLLVGLLGRYLVTLGLPVRSAPDQLHALWQLFGTWVVVTVLMARFSATIVGAMSRTAVFMSGLAIGRFLLGAGFFGMTGLERLTPGLMSGLVVLPPLAAVLWWASHRSWQASWPVQVVGGMLLAAPVALILRESLWLLNSEELPLTAAIMALAAVAVVLLTLRTLAVFGGVVAALVPMWIALGTIWKDYASVLSVLVDGASH